VSFENPMDGLRCDHCDGAFSENNPQRHADCGEKLCTPCWDAWWEELCAWRLDNTRVTVLDGAKRYRDYQRPDRKKAS
jgi:hypothetical protein